MHDISNLFPYEYKSIVKILNTIDTKDIEPFIYYKNDKEVEVPKYLIFFDKDTKRFYRLSTKRFLDKNYSSTKMIDTYFNYELTRKKRKVVHGKSDNYYEDIVKDASDIIDVTLLEDYYELYPDNGYKLFAKKHEANIVDEITYAMTYQKYPFIKEMLINGYDKIVAQYLNDDDIWQEFKIFKNKKLLAAINESDLEEIGYSLINVLDAYNNNKINDDEFLFFLDSDIEAYDYVDFYIDNNYDHKELLEYINRCEIYQAINPKDVLRILESYAEYKKRLGFKDIEKFPVSLKKEREKCYNISLLYDRATTLKNIKEKCKSNFYEKDKYNYYGKDYSIKVETDFEHLASEIKYLKYSSLEYLGFNMQRNYFWIYDKNNKEIIFFEVTENYKIFDIYKQQFGKNNKKLISVFYNFVNRLKQKAALN